MVSSMAEVEQVEVCELHNPSISPIAPISPMNNQPGRCARMLNSECRMVNLNPD